MIRMDLATATFRLGISKEVAEILEQLSLAQIMKMAASNMLMCRFRCDDRTILGLLTDHNANRRRWRAKPPPVPPKRPLNCAARANTARARR
jgi:hypothetical protein